MLGINVKSTSKRRYALDIVNGVKTLETRASDSLRAYVGRRVGVVETGRGKARLVGYVTVGQPIIIMRGDFDAFAGSHLVTPGCDFYPALGANKFAYPMINPTPCAEASIITRGIRARKIPCEG